MPNNSLYSYSPVAEKSRVFTAERLFAPPSPPLNGALRPLSSTCNERRAQLFEGCGKLWVCRDEGFLINSRERAPFPLTTLSLIYQERY